MNSQQITVNAIRILSAEAIQRAKSGHPGIAMGAAPVAYTLWAKHLKHNPKAPNWENRDRFILSSGHGSMLLYSLLHLFGYGNLSVEDLKNFRQIDSITPGHPEYGSTVGVEMTTGPLGQGISSAVGFALAEKHLAAVFNKEDIKIVDHFTFVLCGDGCLMEGVSSEAASMAATMGLGKIIVLYDSNNITIEGSTDLSFTENVLARYDSYGWHTQLVTDGNDIDAIDAAIKQAKAVTDKPSIIEIKTVIGYGSPNKAGKASSHGEPLGVEELEQTRKNLGWDYDEFIIPKEVTAHIAEIRKELDEKKKADDDTLKAYAEKYPDDYKAYKAWFENDFAKQLFDDDDFWINDGDMATRQSSEIVLNKAAKVIPNLFGGSADLSPSNKSVMKDREFYSKENPKGSNVHFGVREHAMAAAANGMVLHGGIQPYVAGFFVFSDYMKPSLRLSAIMKLPVISIFTHDSIGVGEDGPTHQPVEQLAALRSIPNYNVIRPCDTAETAAAWYSALTNKKGPTALIFTRQTTRALKGTGKNALKGAYILKDCQGTPDIILIASGSEVSLIYDAFDVLKEKGIKARVVSMPSFELFEEQSDEYKESVLPKKVTKRLAVEAASEFGWHKYVGLDGDVICMKSYGASAPFKVLFERYGFTVENVVEKAEKLLKNVD